MKDSGIMGGEIIAQKQKRSFRSSSILDIHS